MYVMHSDQIRVISLSIISNIYHFFVGNIQYPPFSYSKVYNILLLTTVILQWYKTPELGQVWWFMPMIPALWEAKAGRSLEVRSSRPVWPIWWNPISTKNTKISQAWWHELVIPATWEAEAGESLEPGSWRLQRAEIMPLHSSLGDRARLSLRIKKKWGSQCSGLHL